MSKRKKIDFEKLAEIFINDRKNLIGFIRGEVRAQYRSGMGHIDLNNLWEEINNTDFDNYSKVCMAEEELKKIFKTYGTLRNI